MIHSQTLGSTAKKYDIKSNLIVAFYFISTAEELKNNCVDFSKQLNFSTFLRLENELEVIDFQKEEIRDRNFLNQSDNCVQ